MPVHKRPKPVCDNLATNKIRDSWDESSCSATISSWGHNSLDASVSISKSPGTLRFLQLPMRAGPGELWAPRSCARGGGRPAALRSSARPCQRGLTPEAKRADICQQGHQLPWWQKVARLRSFPWLVYEGCLSTGLSCLIPSPSRQVSLSAAGSATCSKHLGLTREQTGLTYTGKSYSN